MVVKICVASSGNKKSDDPTRFVLWVGEEGHTKKEISKMQKIIVKTLKENGINYELESGFECA